MRPRVAERDARVARRDDRRADLIVLVPHVRTGLRRTLLGSVAEQGLRQVPCPVFTVKAITPDAEAPDASADKGPSASSQ